MLDTEMMPFEEGTFVTRRLHLSQNWVTAI